MSEIAAERLDAISTSSTLDLARAGARDMTPMVLGPAALGALDGGMLLTAHGSAEVPALTEAGAAVAAFVTVRRTHLARGLTSADLADRPGRRRGPTSLAEGGLVMDGIHDMGGMEGFGPMVRDEALFHAPWERTAFALASGVQIVGNTDEFRHSIERLDPGFYLTADYFGRWLGALEIRLVERGLLDSDDLDARAGSARARPSAMPPRGLPAASPEGGPRRELDRPPRFTVGETVRARDIHPVGHTRLPRYVRGHCGVVTHAYPAFVFPDTHAHGQGDDPQYVYAVQFLAEDLWGEGDHTVSVDLFEPYLETA